MVLFRKINLLLLLLLSTTFANAQSSDEVYKGDNDELYYKYNSADGVLEVCAGENPYYGDIDIPSEASITVAGTPMSLPVVGICKEAFKNCTTLSSVHIPSSVTKIGNDAFNGCSKSYTVYFSSIKHVLSIDYGNQYSNPMFTAGITNIGMKILDKIDFNDIEDCDNIKVIKKYAFVKATWLKEVVLGNNVKEIQNKAFYGCDKLESLVIPSVSTIGTNAFDGCTSLSEIKLPSTLTSIGANAFWGCTGLQYIVIPESVNYIYGSAFSGCKNLTDLIISDRNSTLNIAGGAFSSLKYIYSKAQTAPEAYSDAFGGKTDIQLFYKSGVDYNKAPWEDFNKSPIASNTITYYLDGEPYGTPMSLEAGTVIDPKCDKPDYTSINGREVRWGNEPRIMPNEAVVVNGSSKYLLKYVAGETNDQLNKEDVFYFYGDVISDPKELKKDGLTYTITNSILTMPAKDYSLHVEYSLNQAPIGKTGLKFNNADQDLINYVSLKEGSGKITYSTDTKTFSDKIKAKDAGDYTIYYRVEGITPNYCTAFSSLEVPVTIAPRDDKLTFSLETTSYIYDGAAKEPLPIVKYGETTLTKDVNYTVEYANNTDATTDDVKAKAIIKSIPNGNFSIDKELLFTINKADMDLTFIKTPPSVEDAENLIYNGNELPLIKAGVLEETAPDALELLYSQYKDKDFSTIIPKGTNAGSYTVYYRVKGNNNYKDSNPIALDDQVTIAPKELTPNEIEITLSQSGYTYDGNEKKPDVTVKYGEIEFIIDKDYTVSYSNNKDVGTETKQPTVTITDKDGGNYIVNGIKTFTISPAASKVKNAPTAKTNTYNGTDQVLINGGTSDDGKLQYSLSKDEKSFSEKIPTGKNAGDYTVYYRVKGNANHSDSEISQVKVTIASKEITSFNLSQTSYTYDGSEKKPAVTVTYNNTTVPSSEYTVSYTNNKNAGTATVTLTDKTGGNFNVHGTKTFTINKADGSLKQKPAGIENLTYSGVTQNLITAGSSETGTIEYSLDKVNYGTTIPTGKDAKSYTVYYRVKGDANHKDVNTSQFNVTISKAALTISVGNYEMFEGGTMPTFTINYDGLKNGETDAVFTAKPTVSCKATATSKAGDYTITVSGAKADNYNITHVNGKLAILAKVFVSGGDTSKDEDDPATYQITSSEGDSTPTVSITDDKDVSGKFAIPETVGYHNKNYTVTEIGESAFENNKNLTEVVIPSSITGIGNNAFKGCVNLQAITVYNPTPINLSSVGTRGEGTRSDGSIFDGVNKALCILYVPDESVELYKKALVWRDFQHIVPLSTNTTGINGITQTEDEPFDIYNLQGQKVKSKATNLNGLPKGIYIINGKKYAVK